MSRPDTATVPPPRTTVVAVIAVAWGILLVPWSAVAALWRVAPTTGFTSVNFPLVDVDDEAGSVEGLPGLVERVLAVDTDPSTLVHLAVYSQGYVAHLLLALTGVVVAITGVAMLRNRPFGGAVSGALGLLSAVALVASFVVPRASAWGVQQVLDGLDLPTDPAQAAAAGTDFWLTMPETATGSWFLMIAGVTAFGALYVRNGRRQAPVSTAAAV